MQKPDTREIKKLIKDSIKLSKTIQPMVRDISALLSDLESFSEMLKKSEQPYFLNFKDKIDENIKLIKAIEKANDEIKAMQPLLEMKLKHTKKVNAYQFGEFQRGVAEITNKVNNEVRIILNNYSEFKRFRPIIFEVKDYFYKNFKPECHGNKFFETLKGVFKAT